MSPRGADESPEHSAPGRPGPPYSVDTLADLHAGVLSPDVAEDIRSRIVDDAGAQAVLAALDRTTGDLRSAPVTPVPLPPEVADRTRITLDQISAESSGPDQHRVVGLDEYRRRRRILVGSLAGAAAVVLAIIAVSMTVLRGPSPGEGNLQAQPSTNGGTESLVGGERVTALSVLGRTDNAPFGSEAALRRCTAANGVPAHTAIVGSGPVTLRGRPAVAILLSTGVAGRFDALVVGPDCSTGRPSTISRTVIGG